ncbi:MAG: GNAT family N-acetyltransferase [Fimbriimonadaceae bacterium]
MSTVRAERQTAAQIASSRQKLRDNVNVQLVRDSASHREGVENFAFIETDLMIGHAVVSHGFFDDRVIEFYLHPGFEGRALECLDALRRTTKVRELEAQTNLALPTWLVHASCPCVEPHNVLFGDTDRYELPLSDAVLRPALPEDVIPETEEPTGTYVLEVRGEIVGSGGYLTHYNPPFADVYMGIGTPFRGRGYGAWIVQELRRVAREHDYVPAARCNFGNHASCRSLLRGGFCLAGLIIVGTVPEA